MHKVAEAYCKNNPEADRDFVEDALEDLRAILTKQVGIIELESNLDLETVNEIFNRINRAGVPLSMADFVMSQIASNEVFGGTDLRKTIDYFCHLSANPGDIDRIKESDPEFTKSHFFRVIDWIRTHSNDIYNPHYADVLRVAFSSRLNRGRFKELVGLLKGRDFAQKTYEESIAEDTYSKLKNGIFDFTNKTNYQRFTMIIKSAGYITPKMIRAKNAMNLAYIVYLMARDEGLDLDEIERSVRKWFVFSTLTSRYSGATETQIERDIKSLNSKGVLSTIENVENVELGDNFWDTSIVEHLNVSSVNNNFLAAFFASQIKDQVKGFLSADVSVRELFNHRGDQHHLFPRNYLKKRGFERTQYNQLANFVYCQQEVNLVIGKRKPHEYMQMAVEQCHGGSHKIGNIFDLKELEKNLEDHCVPDLLIKADHQDYENFLNQRRRLMAKRIKDYYYSL